MHSQDSECANFCGSVDLQVTVLLTGNFDPAKKPQVDNVVTVLDTILERSASGFVASDTMTIADISIITTASSLEVN